MGLSVAILGQRILTCNGSVGNGSMAFMGKSAITLHNYENKCVNKAMEMTLSLSSRRLDLEHARNGGLKVEVKEVGLS